MEITTEIKNLIEKRASLKFQLQEVETELANFQREAKNFFRGKYTKKFEDNGISLAFTPAKDRVVLKGKPEKLVKTYPDLFEVKPGFERLRITIIRNQ